MKTVGILGGMGPEASVRFLELLVRNTDAARDEEHVPVILHSRPQTPHRTAAILHGGESPVPWLVRGVEALAAAGADFLVMPCVTAHYFWPQVAPRTRLPFVHLLETAVEDLRKRCPGVQTIGLIATTGTVQARVVHQVFEPAGLRVLTPSEEDQKQVMEAIYGAEGVKAGVTQGRPRQTVAAVARRLVEAGAEAVMAGCTEIPLVLGPEDVPVPFLDPMVSGAKECLRRAGGKLKKG